MLKGHNFTESNQAVEQYKKGLLEWLESEQTKLKKILSSYERWEKLDDAGSRFRANADAISKIQSGELDTPTQEDIESEWLSNWREDKKET